MKKLKKMKIKKIADDFSVCKVVDYAAVNFNAACCFLGKTDEENSLVCLTKDVPANVIKREDGWKAFRIQGELDFTLVGILAKITALLAEQEIGIFALSTFNTDYILTKTENCQKALSILQAHGYEIIE